MSILGTGESVKGQALQGMQKAARLGLEREMANDQLKAQKKQTQMSMAGSGMAAGAQIGGAFGGVYGAAAGAVIGGVAGYFGADLF
jgi:hypothetical protein